MKISDTTMAILKNYASINESLIFREGNRLNTVTNSGNLISFVNVAETFDIEAPIYNLNQFLNTISLFSDPVLDFKSNHVLIKDEGSSSVKYFYASAEVIDIQDREPKMKENILEFILEAEDLQALIKASGVLNLEDLVLSSAGDNLTLSAVDSKNPTSNNFSKIVGDNTLDVDFEFNFKAASLKLIPGNYNVVFSGTTDKSGRQKFLASFSLIDSTLIYYIALDPSSKINKTI